jgi:hypothetical protein
MAGGAVCAPLLVIEDIIGSTVLPMSKKTIVAAANVAAEF